MPLRTPTHEVAADPLGFVMTAAQSFATERAGQPFNEKDLWTSLAGQGTSLEGADAPAPGDAPEERGSFLALLALDRLYTQSMMKRRLGSDGSYVYWKEA